MLLIVSKYLIPKGYRGLTVFPFVFLRETKDKFDKSLINHEQIHLRQQLEMAVIPFFVWYGVEYLVWLIVSKKRKKAYREISFEKEAYQNENNIEYLKNRKFWAFINYVKL